MQRMVFMQFTNLANNSFSASSCSIMQEASMEERGGKIVHYNTLIFILFFYAIIL